MNGLILFSLKLISTMQVLHHTAGPNTSGVEYYIRSKTHQSGNMNTDRNICIKSSTPDKPRPTVIIRVDGRLGWLHQVSAKRNVGQCGMNNHEFRL